MDWSKNFPKHFAPKTGDAPSDEGVTVDSGKKVEFADIGCGYGGLLVALSTVFPDTLMLGKPVAIIMPCIYLCAWFIWVLFPSV